MKLLSISILAFFILVACKSSNQNEALPSCIKEKIETLKNQPLQNPPAEVWEWKDEKSTSYYITSDCCDQFNYLFSDNCETVCAPDGGFTGKGDQKCPEFLGELKKTLIWKDQREVK